MSVAYSKALSLASLRKDTWWDNLSNKRSSHAYSLDTYKTIVQKLMEINKTGFVEGQKPQIVLSGCHCVPSFVWFHFTLWPSWPMEPVMSCRHGEVASILGSHLLSLSAESEAQKVPDTTVRTDLQGGPSDKELVSSQQPWKQAHSFFLNIFFIMYAVFFLHSGRGHQISL